MTNHMMKDDLSERICTLCFDELSIAKQRRYFDVTTMPNPHWDKYLDDVVKRLGDKK
jgi:hypothetical protein